MVIVFLSNSKSKLRILWRRNKDEKIIRNPSELPDPAEIDQILEPWVKSTIIVPQDYLGTVINLCIEKRGKQKSSSIDVLSNSQNRFRHHFFVKQENSLMIMRHNLRPLMEQSEVRKSKCEWKQM